MIKVDKNANCLDGGKDFVVDIGVQTQTANHNSIISDKFLTPRKSIKEVLEICRSRAEIRHKLLKYRCLILSSVLALIGLVISLRMVRRNFDLFLQNVNFLLKFSCTFSTWCFFPGGITPFSSMRMTSVRLLLNPYEPWPTKMFFGSDRSGAQGVTKSSSFY